MGYPFEPKSLLEQLLITTWVELFEVSFGVFQHMHAYI